MNETWDLNTKKELAKKEELSLFSQSAGWKLFRSMLVDKIMDLQSVMNIEGSTAEEIARQVAQRQSASEILVELIKEVDNAQAYLDSLNEGKQKQKEAIIAVSE